jgi:hypothetical protein
VKKKNGEKRRKKNEEKRRKKNGNPRSAGDRGRGNRRLRPPQPRPMLQKLLFPRPLLRNRVSRKSNQRHSWIVL